MSQRHRFSSGDLSVIRQAPTIIRSARARLALLGVLASAVLLPASEGESNVLVDQFRQLDDLARTVQREFVRPIEREELWAGAVRGMVATLDRDSRWLSPEELLLHRSGPAADSTGLGFDWSLDATGDLPRIRRVVTASPAQRHGLTAGDRILAINGNNLSDLGTEERRRLLIALHQGGVIEVLHADQTRSQAEMAPESLRDDGMAICLMLDPERGIGLCRLDRFVASSEPGKSRTATAFRTGIETLRSAGLRALVLDLRGNGGGSLHAAVEIADAFLQPSGDREGTLIVAQIGRNPSSSEHHYATAAATLPNWPVVVLIDRDTASSAEVVAMALQVHRRAVIVGEPSAGKDSVQRLFLLERDRSGLLLTVARWRGPEGLAFAPAGLTPDVLVSRDDSQRRSVAAIDPAAADAAARLLTADRGLVVARDLLTALLVTGQQR